MMKTEHFQRFQNEAKRFLRCRHISLASNSWKDCIIELVSVKCSIVSKFCQYRVKASQNLLLSQFNRFQNVLASCESRCCSGQNAQQLPFRMPNGSHSCDLFVSVYGCHFALRVIDRLNSINATALKSQRNEIFTRLQIYQIKASLSTSNLQFWEK